MSLLTSLRDLKGPDREVDAEIALLLGWQRKKAGINGLSGKPDFIWAEPGERFSYGSRPPSFTESVDAALTIGHNAEERADMMNAFCSQYEGDNFHEAIGFALSAALMARGVK